MLIASVILTEAALIAGLLYERRRRRTAEGNHSSASDSNWRIESQPATVAQLRIDCA